MRGRKPDFDVISGGLSKVPSPPSWLPPEAREEWRRVAPKLVERKVLAEHELSALEQYALHTGLIRRAWKTIEAEGEYVGERRHPAFTTITQSGAESRRWAAELGLTPGSRSKVGTDEPKPEPGDDLGLG